MRSAFTARHRADPEKRAGEQIVRTCVHCGLCTASCPTYVLTGDECDSPRGRIYLIKDMLEQDAPPDPHSVRHIDRCLSCLACQKACPSGVNYMHLADMARAHIERSYRRPWGERWLRRALAVILPRPGLLRLALIGAFFARALRPVLPGVLARLAGFAPVVNPFRPAPGPGLYRAQGARRMRVALLAGCAQRIVAPEINQAAIRLLTRHGAEVVVVRGEVCCGALSRHLGRSAESEAFAARNVDLWSREIEAGGLDAVIATASGCGAVLKDYGHILRGDPARRAAAARIAGLARDASEVWADLGIKARGGAADKLKVAYHGACALQHGQGIHAGPVRLLSEAGFEVVEPAEAHMCCGWAGTYNVLQPDLSEALRARKSRALSDLGADLVAAGNMGCLLHLSGSLPVPALHTAQLLDWASGGPPPPGVRTR